MDSYAQTQTEYDIDHDIEEFSAMGHESKGRKNQTLTVTEYDSDSADGDIPSLKDTDEKIRSDDDHLTDPNNRTAPWYGRVDIDTQRRAKGEDFKSVLSRLDRTLNLTHFTPAHTTSSHTARSDTTQIESQKDVKDQLVLKVQSGFVTSIAKTFTGVLSGVKTTGYRNKNKFTFGYGFSALNRVGVDNSHLKLGFIGGEHPETFICDVTEACTINDTFKFIAKEIESVVKQSSIKPFLQPPRSRKNRVSKEVLKSIPKHRGVWKYLFVRHSVHEDVYVVTLYSFVRNVDDSNRDDYNKTLKGIEVLLRDMKFVRSFNLVEFSETLEPKPTESVINIFAKDGCRDITEKIMDNVFTVSPDSFFQVNTETTEIMYQAVKRLLTSLIEQSSKSGETSVHKRTVLLDLYCGTGTIGLCVMDDKIDHIVGVDVVRSCIDDANVNARLNDVTNFTYITGKCEDPATLQTLKKVTDGDSRLFMIVDPAREGLHKKVRKFIKSFKFDGFIYCSCNVKTWETDLTDIASDVPLRPVETTIVDMFPHTQHYEVVSAFVIDDKS
ncbi:S-adenosylmethionine-dependent methyltransferase [Yasminevirus sp. GU-2018]|uniref:S-adenosylmethionine-dependent methyltransferase n=1 Tax=Yasminevirus sp. GU-2018 TaxID=2420051 RepID=A0A5K0U907_9VIRU|nr:S-adenosylmethionine-dependent methyltransferase [Yasminevirus sp. GU-2018]